MNANHFVRVRPFVYHLTSRENLERILAVRQLEPTSTLLRLAGKVEALRVRRVEHLKLQIEGHTVWIRDQKPLHLGHMNLQGQCFEDLLALINSRVFFWVGTDFNPGRNCLSHFNRYADEKPKILRVRTEDLLSHGKAELCPYNSGAPRCSGGKRSPRGPDTFQPLTSFQGRASDVVELTFSGSVRLPQAIEVADSPMGPWSRIDA